MSLVAKVEILGEFKDLTRATQGATNDLKRMDKKVGGFSRSMRNALIGIAAGISFSALTRGLQEATEAAADDRKSQALLAEVLKNTTDATNDQIASVENQIGMWQNATGILDDTLRPAYSKLIASTEDVTTANNLMEIALDVSAGTGKDLEVVATQLARAQNGNVKALDKLVPGLSDAVDPMGELADKYAGMAETAAENDPISRINVVIADMQELIGIKLLPKLDAFADWLNTPKGTKFIDDISKTLGGIVDAITFLTEVPNFFASTGAQYQDYVNRQNKTHTVDPRSYMPQMATGGIIMPRAGGTAVNVGEAGQAEAIIPLNRLGGLGGNSYTININKASITGKEVVDAIRAYEYSNGRKIIL